MLYIRDKFEVSLSTPVVLYVCLSRHSLNDPKFGGTQRKKLGLQIIYLSYGFF